MTQLEAIKQIWAIVKTESKTDTGINLPSGRYACIFAATSVMAASEYPKRIRVEVHFNKPSKH